MTETHAVQQYAVRLVRERRVKYQGKRVGGAHDAARLLHAILDDSPVERVVVLHLNISNRIQGFEVVAQGGLGSAAVCPADVFRGAILNCAVSIVLGHNHPSGDPSPSDADVSMTRAVAAVGELLGIQLLDHVIVAEGRSASLTELGMFEG
jgi:DNA repair protein RadC